MKVYRLLQDNELDMCLLEKHKERLKSINTNLQGIERDMLLIDDYNSLAGRTASLEQL